MLWVYNRKRTKQNLEESGMIYLNTTTVAILVVISTLAAYRHTKSPTVAVSVVSGLSAIVLAIISVGKYGAY